MLAVAFLGACRAPMPPDNYDAGPEDGDDASALDVSRDVPSDNVDAETDARASDAEIDSSAADAGTADSSTDASDAASD
jgi:hypothetical protein